MRLPSATLIVLLIGSISCACTESDQPPLVENSPAAVSMESLEWDIPCQEASKDCRIILRASNAQSDKKMEDWSLSDVNVDMNPHDGYGPLKVTCRKADYATRKGIIRLEGDVRMDMGGKGHLKTGRMNVLMQQSRWEIPGKFEWEMPGMKLKGQRAEGDFWQNGTLDVHGVTVALLPEEK